MLLLLLLLHVQEATDDNVRHASLQEKDRLKEHTQTNEKC
jgi:hypothetical protein